jgi:hypothetical protein
MVEAGAIAVDWTLNESGFIRGVRYHDGRLAKLDFSTNDALVVIDAVGGGGTTFQFSGSVEFGSIGMVSSAIISDVIAVRIDRHTDLTTGVQEAIHVLLGGMYPLTDLTMADRLLLREEGRLLVSFNCSYGGPFSFLADHMATTREGY